LIKDGLILSKNNKNIWLRWVQLPDGYFGGAKEINIQLTTFAGDSIKYEAIVFR
jgi:hypothetical protein